MFTKTIQSLSKGSSVIQYSEIPWDSQYLKNKTVEITTIDIQNSTDGTFLLKKLERTLKLKNNDLLFCKLTPEQLHTAQILYTSGFYWMEQSITLSINLTKWIPEHFTFSHDKEYMLKEATTLDMDAIKKIAQKTFIADRYHLDPYLSKEGANVRFEMWIENSFNNSDSIYKFVNTSHDIAGFFIISEQGDTSELRLAGLDPIYIGQGLGRMLYHHMYALLKKKGFKKTEAVISLNNIAVLNVYMYLGSAKFIDPYLVFHKVIH